MSAVGAGDERSCTLEKKRSRRTISLLRSGILSQTTPRAWPRPSTLSPLEERSQLDVFYELTATGADVIRMRSSSRSSRGALSLRQSVDMLNDAHDLLASAARAVEKPQAAYRGRPSVDVVEYLDSVQPLPGYHEGYALTLYSPVSVGIEAQSDFGDDYHTPFPRLTTQKLARALECTNMAIDEVVAKDSLESFEQAVRFGVSANLCDSVAALAKKGQGIETRSILGGCAPIEFT